MCVHESYGASFSTVTDETKIQHNPPLLLPQNNQGAPHEPETFNIGSTISDLVDKVHGEDTGASNPNMNVEENSPKL